MSGLKFLVVTTPIRPIPTEYPPLGSLTLVNALRKAGNDQVQFYDIDGLRQHLKKPYLIFKWLHQM